MKYNNCNLIINEKGEVIIPDGVTEIEDRTGQGNSSIVKVIIPGSIESIRNCVFEGCVNLKEVIFKHNYTTNRQWNGSGIFRDCPNLKKLYFEDFETFDSYTYDTGGPLENGAELYIGGKQIIDFVIPTNINQNQNHQCFRNLRGAVGIKNVKFENGDEVIGYSYEINNKNCHGTRYGITKREFEEKAFLKYTNLNKNLTIKHFKSMNELLSDDCCRYSNSIITSYDDFEKVCLECIYSVTHRF